MNRPAQMAKDRAERRKRRKARVGIALYIASAAILVATGYVIPRDMELPPVGDPVMVRTATRWHMAYLDEAGEFRQVWTGERVGQVTQWKRP